MNFDNIQNYGEEIYKNLLELIKTPGPSLSCARVLGKGKKEREQEDVIKDFPLTKTVKRIIEGFEKSCNIKLLEDHGNIVLVGGLDSNDPDEDEIKDIPIVLGAHLDEVTYLISNKSEKDKRIIFPLCSPPTRAFMHKEAEVLGLRNGELITVAYGIFEAEEIRKVRRDEAVVMERWKYLLKEERKLKVVLPGDIVIQNYMKFGKYDGLDSVIEAKALDDRVGTVAVLYALRFLSKHMPIKAILSGDEEGVPRDVSWARLILPTYRRFCTNDVITILCDGVNGADIKECPDDEGNFLSDALLLPYTAEGKGGGDYRLFSLIKEKIVPICKKNAFNIRWLTDYASRSFDPKIMNEYPLMTFIDWSNGLVGNHIFKCHYHEEVLFEQVLNIIGCIYWTCMFLRQNRSHLTL